MSTRLIFTSPENLPLKIAGAIIFYYRNDAYAINTRRKQVKLMRELGLECVLASHRMPTGSVGHSIIIKDLKMEEPTPIRCLAVDLARIKKILNLSEDDISRSISVYVYINLTRAQRRELDNNMIFNEAD